MFDSVAEFLKEFFVKFSNILPKSPFDLTDELSFLRGYTSHINYFIPFYIYKDIFNVWLLCMFSAFAGYIFIMFVKNILGK